MDETRFDLLTRRFVLGGLVAWPLVTRPGLEAARATRKSSKRKRCRRKRREFCAGRCCRRRHRCEDKTCVQSCDDPFVCPDDGSGAGCGGGAECFCSTSSEGTPVCVVSEPAPCASFASCNVPDPCPAGQICAICGCAGDAPDFRCKRSCPAG